MYFLMNLAFIDGLSIINKLDSIETLWLQKYTILKASPNLYRKIKKMS